MPAYRSLFDGAPDRPRQGARDLVAYLETLGRARELAWPEGDEAARAALPDDRWKRMAFSAPQLNAHPARTQPRGTAPEFGPPAPADVGRGLWRDHCAGCHGDDGRGQGPAARWLRPLPPDLSERTYSTILLADVLWNGVRGTAMPGWRDLPRSQLAALVEVVRSFTGADVETAPSPAQLSLGRQVYAAHCAECHGPGGAGDGFAARELPIAATDFRNERPSIDASLGALRFGIDGTPMAPWTDRLDDEEIVAVAHYLRQFFQNGARSDQIVQ
jgi:mono/diheme cytochrome c family protein